MKKNVRALVKSRELLWAFTWRNIALRYKQSVMGFLWALFMPALIVLSGMIVKKAMAMMSGNSLSMNEMVSVSVRALPWSFFVGSLKFAVNSLIGNSNMVQKIAFPREIFPLSYTLAQMFDFLVASAVLAVVMLFIHLGASLYLLWVPVFFALLFLLTAGLGLILSCGALFFRDVKYIVDIMLTFGIFFTPVFYSADTFKDYSFYLMLNPLGALLENLNTVVVLRSAPSIPWLIYSAGWAVVVFILSWIIFKKSEPYFAENI